MTLSPIDRLAQPLARFPRLGLAQLPTVLEPLRRLSAHLGGPTLWVKREDCTGLGFGGNKLRKLYVVPYGVSDGLGAVGYASTALEIARQSAEAGFAPDAIVHASGSGATQAGLVLGAAVCLPDCRVTGIDIDAEPARVRADII